MIEDWKDAYAKKTVFVVGNGPSLNVLPVEKLREHYTVVVNDFIPYGIERYSFAPSFWASSYAGDYENHLRSILSSEKLDRQRIRLVLPEDYFSVLREGWRPPVSPVTDRPIPDMNRISEVRDRFSCTGAHTLVVPVDLLPPRFFGVGVITHLAVPFCCYLGFKRIVFVGMDLGGWNSFYSPRTDRRLRRARLAEIRRCWDGRDRSNYEAVKDLNYAIFSRRIPEYNQLIPTDVKFYHTTPRPKQIGFLEKLWTRIGLSEEARTGFVDITGEGFYIHRLEDFVEYIDLDDAVRMAERREHNLSEA